MMNRTFRKSIVLMLTAVLLASVLSGCGFSLAPSAPTSVTLDAQKLQLVSGDTAVLTATVSGEEEVAVTWSSDDPSVAEVNENGEVTAVNSGVTGIHASIASGPSAECAVTVLFKDMTDETDPFFRPVYWAVENGIAEGGTGEKTGEFGTEDLVTRAEAVDFIWKMFRKPSVDPEDLTEFSDVPETSPFYDAVQWAASQGVAIGYADEKGKPSGSFGPGDICSRGEFLTILWRFSKPRPVDPENLPSFSDVRESDYFYEAVMAAVQFGIADGETDANGEPLGTFGPSEYCTKAQAMEYLYRFMRPAESEG